MKTSSDPRHKKRELLLAKLFASSFIPGFTTSEDELIHSAAPDWPINKMNRIDLSILRLATKELTGLKVPIKVVIDEAVELGKKYGAEHSSSFINGVLGTISKQLE